MKDIMIKNFIIHKLVMQREIIGATEQLLRAINARDFATYKSVVM